MNTLNLDTAIDNSFTVTARTSDEGYLVESYTVGLDEPTISQSFEIGEVLEAFDAYEAHVRNAVAANTLVNLLSTVL